AGTAAAAAAARVAQSTSTFEIVVAFMAVSFRGGVDCTGKDATAGSAPCRFDRGRCVCSRANTRRSRRVGDRGARRDSTRMRELFRGTVTLLFTDIEGSTRLLHTYGRDAYVASLELHRRLLRDVFADHDGVEVEMQGDSFFFAFRAANAAAAAAAAGQRVLASADWGSGPPIGVRMGLHTGEPTVSDGLYAGLDVHRAARVMAAAHGGQVLLSARTADLVQDALPPGARLRPLGRFLLKDFDGGELLTQLELADTGDRFRPPRAERQPAAALRYAPRPVRRHPVVALAAAALVAAGVVVPVVML